MRMCIWKSIHTYLLFNIHIHLSPYSNVYTIMLYLSLIICIFQILHVSMYLFLDASNDIYTLVTPCSRVSISIFAHSYLFLTSKVGGVAVLQTYKKQTNKQTYTQKHPISLSSRLAIVGKFISFLGFSSFPLTSPQAPPFLHFLFSPSLSLSLFSFYL